MTRARRIFSKSPKLPPLRLDSFSDGAPAPPRRLELALILMFVAGFLSGGGLVAFICRLIILSGGCL